MAYVFNPFTGNLDSYGPILTGTGTVSAAADGTAALPGIAFASDTNTGIYRPGADQLAISTGGNGRLFVDATGKVGIGTSNPGAVLDVFTGTNRYVRLSTNGDASLIRTTESGGANRGFSVAGQYIRFDTGTNANSTINERLRIDSAGRLLIGTSSWYTIPDSRFGQPWLSGQQIKFTDNGTYGGLAIISATSTVNQRVADLSLNRQNGNTDYAALSSGSPIGSVTFNGADGSKFVRAASITAFVDGNPGADDMPGRLVFSTTADGASSPTERMRITSAGNVGINVTPTSKLEAKEDTSSAETVVFRIISNWSSSGQTQMLVLSDGEVENRNNAYRAISDAKLKENITDANSQWEDIKSLRVRNYNFIQGAGDPSKKHIGLIAQETELVSPGLVAERADQDNEGNDLGTTTKSVNYSVLYMKAVKALQEAMERIETLEQRLNDAGIN